MVQPMNVDEPRWFIYAYIDPTDGEPFYIGKGHGTRDRKHLNGHLLKKRKLFYNKLRKMLRDGRTPEIRRLLTGLTNAEALIWEMFFIKAIGRRPDSNNPGPLCNLTDGGEGISGKRHGEKTRQRLREHRLRQMESITVEDEQHRKVAAVAGVKRAAQAGRFRWSSARKAAASLARRGRRPSASTKHKMGVAQIIKWAKLRYFCTPPLPIDPQWLKPSSGMTTAENAAKRAKRRHYDLKGKRRTQGRRAAEWCSKNAYPVPTLPLDPALFISPPSESS